jgi:hypothetical protein
MHLDDAQEQMGSALSGAMESAAVKLSSATASRAIRSSVRKVSAIWISAEARPIGANTLAGSSAAACSNKRRDRARLSAVMPLFRQGQP